MAAKGRGYGRGVSDSPNAQVLRRPQEAGLLQRLESLNSTKAILIDIESEISGICEKMVKTDLNSKEDLSFLVDKIKLLCQSVEDMEKCIQTLFEFAVKSKWNAHITAVFCNSIGDISVNETKFRTNLLRKLQAVYKERNKNYLELESFLLEVTFLCEIYHHVRIDGSCLKVLSKPINDYFGMLIDGTSQKEIEVFIEQFPKCYHNLKVNDHGGLDTLICKLRKQIICEPSNVVVKSMLLEIFERILTDFEPLNQNAKNLYESLSKPIIRICE